MIVTFRCWTHGDMTVGDGTLSALVTVDIAHDMAPFTKDQLRECFSTLWDTDARRVHVMTEAEFNVYVE